MSPTAQKQSTKTIRRSKEAQGNREKERQKKKCLGLIDLYQSAGISPQISRWLLGNTSAD